VSPLGVESFAPRWILHPTDFSPQSDIAFAHALAIALKTRAKLTIIHVAPADTAGREWTDFPAVRQTLERWGLLEAGSPRSSLPSRLGIQVEKVDAASHEPLGAILDYARNHPVELMVLATHGREGLPRWLHRAVAEPLGRRSKTPTLFVPPRARGFVAPDSGHLTLRRVLVPVDRTPDPGPALDVAAGLATTIGVGPGEFALLHVGEESDLPNPVVPLVPSWTWNRAVRQGRIVGEIVAHAEETGADAIVMATEGREGILDALRGSTTEQVIRLAPCPVLAVPSLGQPGER
jgi:nucleotide-binding universal stress UspA family protein